MFVETINDEVIKFCEFISAQNYNSHYVHVSPTFVEYFMRLISGKDSLSIL